MNIRDLKYLVALADHGHFGKAATACFVSQPALSMQIKKLEDTLGTTLLERNPKTLLFTEPGLAIIERARELLYLVEQIKKIADTAKDPVSGELTLGIFPTLAPFLLPHIIPFLAKTYPKLTLHLIEEKTTPLIVELQQGRLDAAFLALPIEEKNFHHAVLFEEAFMLCVPLNHPLAKRASVNIEHLANETFLLLEEGHCLRDQSLAICHKMHLPASQNFRATSLETVRHMVSAGAGITLMPSLACTANAHLAYIPFSPPKPTRTIGLFWRASSAKQVLLQEISEHIKTLVVPML